MITGQKTPMEDILEQARRILMQNDAATAPQTGASPCCSSEKQDTCCAPSEKSTCCGAEATAGGGCGCQ
jgi:hypothetical protein